MTSAIVKKYFLTTDRLLGHGHKVENYILILLKRPYVAKSSFDPKDKVLISSRKSLGKYGFDVSQLYYTGDPYDI